MTTAASRRRRQVSDMLVDMSGNMMHDESKIVIRLPSAITMERADDYRNVLFLCMELMKNKIHELDIIDGS